MSCRLIAVEFTRYFWSSSFSAVTVSLVRNTFVWFSIACEYLLDHFISGLRWCHCFLSGICTVTHCTDTTKCLLSLDKSNCKCAVGYYGDLCDKGLNILVDQNNYNSSIGICSKTVLIYFSCYHQCHVWQRLHYYHGEWGLFPVLQSTYGISALEEWVLSCPKGGYVWCPILHCADIKGSVRFLWR